MAEFGYTNELEKRVSNILLKRAFAFLKSTDLNAVFAKVAPGKNVTVEIEGKDLFAIFQEYDSKLHANAKSETHRIYTDIQYIHEGSEIIGVAGLADITEEDTYNSEKDISFPKASHLTPLMMKSGMAAILYPEDVHAPGMAVENKPTRVKKIVFKVKL
jgi:YhcH/YjgK/YiaL family protein